MFSTDHPFQTSPSSETEQASPHPESLSKYDKWREGRTLIMLNSKVLLYPFLAGHLLRLQDEGYVFETILKKEDVSVLLEVRGFPASQDPDTFLHKGIPKFTPARCVVRVRSAEGSCPPYIKNWGGMISQPHLLGWWNGKHEHIAQYLRGLLPKVEDLREYRII